MGFGGLGFKSVGLGGLGFRGVGFRALLGGSGGFSQ